jgi:COP9 signalosome complex subunit 7
MSSNALVQFLALVKSAKQPKLAAKLVTDAIAHPGAFVFSELLAEANVQALKGSDCQKEFDTLCLFAYGTYSDYLAKKENFIVLSDKLLYKLKQLSVVSFSASQRVLSYKGLLKQLEIENVRQLEDLLIDCVYNGLIKAKLDQKSKTVEVFETLGRDVPNEHLDVLINTLKSWYNNSKDVMSSLDKNSSNAIGMFEATKKQNSEYENYVENLKKEIKTSIESQESLNPGMIGFTGGMMDPRKKKY